MLEQSLHIRKKMANKILTHVIYLLLLSASFYVIFLLNNKPDVIISDVDTIYIDKIVTLQITDTVYAEIVTFESDTLAFASGTTVDSLTSSQIDYKITYNFNKQLFTTDFIFDIPIQEKMIIKNIIMTNNKVQLALLTGVHGNNDGYEVTLGVGLTYKRIGLFVSGNTNKTIGLSFIYEL